MKCPTCGSEEFYIKDEDDEYDIYEFTCSDREVVFSEEADAELLGPSHMPKQTCWRGGGWV